MMEITILQHFEIWIVTVRRVGGEITARWSASTEAQAKEEAREFKSEVDGGYKDVYGRFR